MEILRKTFSGTMANENEQKFFSVVSVPAPKLDLYSIQNEGGNIHVYYAVIIRLLCQILRLPYKILLPSGDEVSAKLPDGNWTGITGMAHRSEADLAVCSPMSYPKFQAINYSYPYLFSDLTFMTDKPKPDPSILAIIHAFPSLLWILLLSVTFFFSCVLYIHVYRKHTFQNILFMLLGSLLEKAIEMQVRKLSIKMILSTWFIFIFVIINSYKAVLLSILTLPHLTGIKDISDLAKAAEQNSIKCYGYKEEGFGKILLESEFATWRSIGKCMQRNVINSEDAEVAFLMNPSNKAFITTRSFLRPYEETYFISDDSFFNSIHAIAVSKAFRKQTYLNERIHHLFATGVFQKIEKDEQFTLKLKTTPSQSSEPGRIKILQLQDLKEAFVVLFSGYALSTIVLFIEIAVKRYFPKSNVTLSKKRREMCRK